MAGHEITEPKAPTYVLVILPDQGITLPEMHIQAGRIVLIIPAPNATGIKAKPKQDRS